MTQPAVIITGASEGIGLELAKRFAASGHVAFVLIARSADGLAALANVLCSDYRVRVVALALDLTEAGAVDRIEDCLAAEGWHAEVLVNNAGIGLSGVFCDGDPIQLGKVLALNVSVPVALTRRFLPGMRARRKRCVLHMGSLGGYVPGPGQAVYYASKAFLISFSKSVRQELRESGVRMTVVAPGPVDTHFHQKMGADAARYRLFLPQARPAWIARLAVLGLQWDVAVVLPGPLSVVAVLATRLMPNFILARIMGWLLGGGGGGIN